ncbi:tetratricopeptide repeat protein [Puteibacter caeruleilacunae]|nr:tetratricopeptide repeat protein [Puteibacter caeruleilacunae]
MRLFGKLLGSNSREDKIVDLMDQQLIKDWDRKFTYGELELSELETLLKQYECNDFLISLLGITYLQRNEDEKAIALLKSKIKQYPDLHESTYINWCLGAIAIDNEDVEVGEKYLISSLRNDSNDSNKWVRLELFLLFKDIDYSSAFKYLNEALDLDDKFVDAQVELCNHLVNQKEYTAAMEILDSILEVKEMADVYFRKGQLHIDSGNIDLAKEAFERSLEIEDNCLAYMGLGDVEFYYERYLSAKNYYQKAIDENRRYSEVFCRIGVTEAKLGNSEEALEAFIKAYEICPDTETRLDLIYGYLLVGDLTQANKINKAMIENNGPTIGNELFSIVINAKKERTDNVNFLLQRISKTYSLEEVEWLYAELNNWGIKCITQ